MQAPRPPWPFDPGAPRQRRQHDGGAGRPERRYQHELHSHSRPAHEHALGDLDPGLAWYLARTEQVTAKQFHHMVNHESGLLGVSETSSDMRELLLREENDVRAAEAVALFCYQAKKWICALAGALEGLDTLVFAGGIGENSPEVRARICRGLGFIGIRLDEGRNSANAPVISCDGGPATARVIRTDEELIIAKTVCRILAANVEKE